MESVSETMQELKKQKKNKKQNKMQKNKNCFFIAMEWFLDTYYPKSMSNSLPLHLTFSHFDARSCYQEVLVQFLLFVKLKMGSLFYYYYCCYCYYYF